MTQAARTIAMPDSPNTSLTAASHTELANAIRALAMDGVEQAKSGHPGMPMGMADVAAVLYTKFLKFDAADPAWPDRDRFILSAGHGSMLLYALNYLTGYKGMTLDELKRFRQLGSKTPGHPERDVPLGIETTTGPLGQGISNAVGFALAERVLNARFGDDLVDHRTFVIASDGDLMEGISHEACSLAGHLRLNRLVVYYDDNAISIDGPTDLSFSDDTLKRFESYGWAVSNINGHDPAAITQATEQALRADRPVLIACKTTIGFGAPTKGGTAGCHGSPLGAEEIKAAREKLGWPHAPFEVPENILRTWREAGNRGAVARAAWAVRHGKANAALRTEFDRTMSGALPKQAGEVLDALRQKIAAEKPKDATRVSSGKVLEALLPVVPELTGGSADLTPSNNTQVKNLGAIKAGNYAGRYIHYGVREHGMAAAMNGMALHGGIIPYSGTFLQFADYCRPAIRLASLMKQRVVFVMTHDSIGLGEDGPTHQPVEHLAALRAIPGLLVMRPCDGIETAECWQLALETRDAPSLLALTRQGIPTLRAATTDNMCAHGAYVLADAEGARQVTLLATGSEVSVAMAAREQLKAVGIDAAVVSMPCQELFERQDEAYRAAVLGDVPRVAVEAGIRQCWDRYLGPDGRFVGMKGFGESAPADDLFKHFGITGEAVAAAAQDLLKS
ncbi:MAG: transketolase [Alphaproteobacteria bacterium]|nr:transketolase [Alphaproteobacteria bacterium]